jgi:hypothetical protein
MRKSFVFIFAICLIIPSISHSVSSLNNSINEEGKIIGAVTREIDIPAGSDYFIKFSSDNLTLEEQNIVSYSTGLSEKIKDAIAKSPRWIQRELTRQFHAIDGEEYADMILEMGKKYVDEIAFIIARSSLGKPPSVDIIIDNVLVLYENDKWLNYADIVDYDDTQGNYYSTVRYKVIENDIVKQLEYPPEIYYEHIVHPEIISKAEFIYGRFWRDYLFNHNDLGYPLLKEKLSEIEYLWDCKSYSQPGNRLWTWSMDNHPTAVEAISYWIGKTVPAQAYGDRPGQPNVIAHEHNGWCGELKTIAVAAQCAALIPSIDNLNIGEDHVWRQFYERGWHHSDNWWADGGGAIDNPDIYAYGWGKDMSAIYAIKGDHSIYEVTSTYIHPEDRKTICFQVYDRLFNPVDGARITVTVEGPKDITWLKYRLFEITENLWNKIPPLLRGKILQFLYNKIRERSDEIPDIVDGSIYCIWNYTDINGKCYFELGQNRSYVFIIQYGNLREPNKFASQNDFRILENPIDRIYNIWYPFLSPKLDKYSEVDIPYGDISFNVAFDTKSYQVQGNLKNFHKIPYDVNKKIDFFIVDENNFIKYKDGLNFKCHEYKSIKEDNFVVNAQKNNWYLVFRNNCRETNIVLNCSVYVATETTEEKVKIVNPDRSIFNIPSFNIGETVTINGIATNDISLYIDENPNEVEIQDYEWTYVWETSALIPGNYSISVECGDEKDEMLIRLIDVIPPHIKIETPFDNYISEGDILTIEGHASDNLDVNRIEVSFDDGEWREANGTEQWSLDWDISGYNLGDHIISARAFDSTGCISLDKIHIVINESGHSWGPQINSFYHKPDNPTNLSSVIIYSNVTMSSPFLIQRVVLFWDDGNVKNSGDMFRYGDNPVQERHEEDPLKNMSNEPIFGRELGQFSTHNEITYWIEAFDTANNKVTSSKKILEIV